MAGLIDQVVRRRKGRPLPTIGLNGGMTTPRDETMTWLTRLVGFDTTSRDSNRELIDTLALAGTAAGLQPRVLPDTDDRKANLVISVPAADGSIDGGVMLAGHVDCVPVDGQAWSGDPFRVEVREGLVYGRGTADMKGFDAAVAAALPDMVAAPLREPIHVCFTYDEEVGCRGAQPLVDALHDAGIHPRVCFVGEPTSMRMIRAHKSINVAQVTVRGLGAHSSLTPDGVNAIEYAARIVRFHRDRSERWRAEGPFDEAYPVPYSTGSVNQISGGTAVNIVPEQCTVGLEWRSLGELDDAAEIAALQDYCAGVERDMRLEHPEASITVEMVASAPGLDTPEDAAVVRLGRELDLDVGADKVTYGTEAGIYDRAGISTVVVGPGDIAQAHKADEFVSLDQLAACDAFIARLIEHLRAEQ